METLPALRHEVWEWTPPEAQAYIRALEARVETMVSIVHSLQEQVRTLQEQLNQPSQTSSWPPSSDPPQHRRSGHPQSRRRRGGQPGHPGHPRTLIPVEEVDEVVVLKPAQCTHCQAPLSGDDPKPWRHQVSEIPPIKPVVTEYQWHQLACPACGEITRAPWPASVPSGTYGPRVQAAVALLRQAGQGDRVLTLVVPLRRHVPRVVLRHVEPGEVVQGDGGLRRCGVALCSCHARIVPNAGTPPPTRVTTPPTRARRRRPGHAAADQGHRAVTVSVPTPDSAVTSTAAPPGGEPSAAPVGTPLSLSP